MDQFEKLNGALAEINGHVQTAQEKAVPTNHAFLIDKLTEATKALGEIVTAKLAEPVKAEGEQGQQDPSA